MRSHAPRRWPAYAAAAWAFAFAALSLFWAAGGSTGLHPLESLPPATAALVNVPAAAAKVLLGVLALAAVSPRAAVRVPRRLLVAATWTAGVGLLGYGLFGLGGNGLVLAGVVDIGQPVSRWYRYYLLIWDPYFVLGGILFTTVALSYRLPGRRTR